MRKSFHDRLGLSDAPEDRADVIVKGVITAYDADVPANVSANPAQVNVSRRTLQLVLTIEMTNTKTGKPLLKQKECRARAHTLKVVKRTVANWQSKQWSIR